MRSAEDPKLTDTTVTAVLMAAKLRRRAGGDKTGGHARGQPPIADTIAILQEMPITEGWIKEEFLSARLKPKPSSHQKPKKIEESEALKMVHKHAALLLASKQSAELPKLSKELLARLNNHGIYSRGQLKDVAMQTGGLEQFHEILQSKGAADIISEYFDKQNALIESAAPVKSILLTLTGRLDKMDAFLMNYGLAASLITAALMTCYTSITNEDWGAYLPIVLREQACQDKAKGCGPEVLSPDHLGWEPLYCQVAVHLLLETPYMNLLNTSNPDLSCCMDALECAKLKKWNLELAFTLGCGGGSALMLLVLLFSSWLYIALHGSSANRERYEEAELLRERFRQEFLLLHTLFLGGVFCTFVGLIAVMSLKVSTLFLSWLAWGITFGSGVCAFALFLKLPWEVYYLNQTIDKVRGFDKAKLAVEYENALKAVCRHLRSLDSVEGSLEEIECLRHIRRAGGRGRAGGPGPGPAARGARDGGRAGPVRDSRE
jgi:hypothetical protein